jgi:hypothetical protein
MKRQLNKGMHLDIFYKDPRTVLIYPAALLPGLLGYQKSCIDNLQRHIYQL